MPNLVFQAGHGCRSWMVFGAQDGFYTQTTKAVYRMDLSKKACIRLAKRLRDKTLPQGSRWVAVMPRK